MVRTGDTFLLLPSEPERVPHLYIVLSDPAQDSSSVVVTPVTTWEEYKDDSCMLDVGDHPSVKHKSCMDYRHTRVLSAREIDDAKSRSEAIPRAQITGELLQRVLSGASRTKQLPRECDQVLAKQNLID